jgi:digeranylgeranylglycerophospholipid reductase
MKKDFDVIVVGAGPAGSVAARKASEAGLKTLLLEKRPQIGIPVRCAEAIGEDTSKAYIDPDPKWICAEISRFAVWNSKRESALFPPTEPTIVVNREVFDQELANLAENAGAEVRTNCPATDVILIDEQVIGVEVEVNRHSEKVQARLVIAADGTESQVARWAGMKTTPPLADYFVGIEYHLQVRSTEIYPKVCEYHLDHSLAPGGYLWVFPKGRDQVNAGLVVPGSDAGNCIPLENLRRFCQRRFSHRQILKTMAGGIPVTGALPSMVANGLMLVGDAAHQADPMMAGGICLGMVGADLAMQVGIPAIWDGDVSKKRLSAYDLAWKRKFGKMHAALYQLRKIFAGMGQSRMDDLLGKAAKLPLAKMTLAQIVLTLLKTDPKLLFEARTLITTGLISK